VNVDSDQALPKVAVIVSRYNASITEALLAGALEEYAGRGGESGTVDVYRAPGAYELTALSLAAAQTGRYRGVVALGCLIRGETRHDRYIADAVSHGLTQVTLQTGIPVAFGVLTVESGKQARARAGGEKGNKGADAMGAVLDAIGEVGAIRSGTPGSMVAPAPDKALKDTLTAAAAAVVKGAGAIA
jgi:6,7-dimethyl-8-ribityllumazine synthase